MFRRDLLLKLAEKMESLRDPALLRQSAFYSQTEFGRFHTPTEKIGELLYGADQGHFCGTSACALGWATTIPEWQKEGFTWSGYLPAFWNRKNHGVPLYTAEILGLNGKDYQALFGMRPATPAQKAMQIRELIARYDADPAKYDSELSN